MISDIIKSVDESFLFRTYLSFISLDWLVGCTAATVRGMLIVRHPAAPEDVAGEILREKKTVKVLKECGFTRLRVHQGNGEPFDFAIRLATAR